jgi:hypothetical protein
MKKFVRQIFYFSIIGLIPIAIGAIAYIALDPFKVLHQYDVLIEANAKEYVTLNKDYVSTTAFIRNSNSIHYNSFIFGNSRSIFFQISDWKKHLNSDASCFHYDASDESLWALNKKVEFIDNHGTMIENVLLVLDYMILEKATYKKRGHLHTISPALVNNENLLEFHLNFFTAFMNPKFLFAYIDFKLSGRVKPYMKRNLMISQRHMTI